jgi:hypothetical protein
MLVTDLVVHGLIRKSGRIIFPYISRKLMSSDSKMLIVVRSSLARRLPTDLVALMLEFTNWEAHYQRKAFLEKFSNFTTHIRGLPIYHFRRIHIAANFSQLWPNGNSRGRPCLLSNECDQREAIHFHTWMNHAGNPITVSAETDYVSCLYPCRIWCGGVSVDVPLWAGWWERITRDYWHPD